MRQVRGDFQDFNFLASRLWKRVFYPVQVFEELNKVGAQEAEKPSELGEYIERRQYLW